MKLAYFKWIFWSDPEKLRSGKSYTSELPNSTSKAKSISKSKNQTRPLLSLREDRTGKVQRIISKSLLKGERPKEMLRETLVNTTGPSTAACKREVVQVTFEYSPGDALKLGQILKMEKRSLLDRRTQGLAIPKLSSEHSRVAQIIHFCGQSQLPTTA